MGSEVEKKSLVWNLFSLFDTVKGNVFNEIIGTTSYHFTKLVASMTGPLQLLPTNEHRVDYSLIDNPDDQVSKNNWLDVKHNFI